MPLYEYQCQECANEFKVLLKLEDYSPLRVCPKCNGPSPQKISAAMLQILKRNERIVRDRNERAVYEPVKVTRQHQCSHSDCDHDKEGKNRGTYQQISKGSRPWMLG